MMRKKYLLTPLLFLSFFFCCINTVLSGNQKVELFDTPLLDHPRLLFTQSEEDEIHRMIPQDPLLSDLVNLLREDADRLLDGHFIDFPAKPVNINNTMLNISRGYLYRVITLGMAYRIFNETKYAEKAIDHMLNACSYPTWNPGHFLDVAEMTAAIAIGYDWLYPVLTKDERVLIVNALKEKAILLAINEYSSPRKNSWSTRETNWNTVCNSGISLGVLAIAEEFKNENKGIPEFVINHAATYMPNNLKTFQPDGVAYEGPAYAQYTINYYSMLSKALHDNLGNDRGLSDVPGIKNFGDFYYQTVSPNKTVFNFGDASAANASRSPFYFFYSKVLNQYHLSTFYKDLVRDVIDKKVNFPQSIFFLSIAWYDTREFDAPDIPGLLKIFESPINPIAVFNRTDTSPNAIYLIAKGGKPDETHQHLDMGSFIVENQGIRWFDDVGQESYSLPGFWERYPTGRRWGYFRNSSYSHNVSIIDNKIQYPKGRSFIERYENNSEVPFVIFNLDSAYVDQAESVARGFKLLDSSMMLLQDEFIIAKKGQEVTESFLTRASIRFEDEIITLERNGKLFYMKVLEPSKVTKEKIDASTQITDIERSVDGFHLLKITTKASKNNDKIVFRILMSSQIDKLQSILLQDRSLHDW